MKKQPLKPSNAELAILQVLWKQGPSTVRETHEGLGPDNTTTYTTTLKLLQIMHEKGLVRRNEKQRAHIYKPCISEKGTQKGLVKEFLNRVFEGSLEQLVHRSLDVKKASPEELAAVRKLLDELENK